MNNYNRSRTENISDVILFIGVTIPFLLLWVTGFFCSGWNEGSMSWYCSISLLTPLYNNISYILLLIAFGGIIYIAPFYIIFFLLSLVTKIIRYIRKQYPKTPMSIFVDIVTLVPIISVMYLFSIFF